MKKQILMMLVGLLFVATGTATAQSESQWIELFNGKNFKGWKKINGEAEYKVEDGTIVGISKIGQLNTFLVTEKAYDDFILEFDFKVEDGLNSGVQFRSLSEADYRNGRMHGYQFEIDPSERAWTGGIYDEEGRGWLYPMTAHPQAQGFFRNNDWNSARIEAIGNSIRTYVNGRPCAAILDDQLPSGYIGLQVHAIRNPEDEGKTICWRDIRICTENPAAHTLRHSWPDAPQINYIANTISDNEKVAGWELLWDGQTTDGWRGAKLDQFPAKGWAIEDGFLKVLKSDGGESTNGGDIVTDRTYKNFILRVDFKITPGANSGIKYFVDPELNRGQGSAIGCEFQILDDDLHPDAKLGVNGNRTVGGLYDLIPPINEKFFRKSDINVAHIVVDGNHVEHWLNWVKVVEYDRNNQMWDALVSYSKYRNWPNFGNAEEGHILLQDHGDEVWFQNIKIKELR